MLCNGPLSWDLHCETNQMSVQRTNDEADHVCGNVILKEAEEIPARFKNGKTPVCHNLWANRPVFKRDAWKCKVKMYKVKLKGLVN